MNILRRTQVMLAVGAVALAASGGAFASPELSTKLGCSNCHDVSAKKMGPAYKDVAAKQKGKADSEKTIVEKLKSGKGHPPVKASDGDLATVTKWILTL